MRLAPTPTPPPRTRPTSARVRRTESHAHADARARCRPDQLPFNIHLHETAAEVEHSRSGQPSMSRHRSETLMSPLENFARLGLVSSRLVAVHMTQLSDDEIHLLATHQGTGPASRTRRRHPHRSARVLITYDGPGDG